MGTPVSFKPKLQSQLASLLSQLNSKHSCDPGTVLLQLSYSYLFSVFKTLPMVHWPQLVSLSGMRVCYRTQLGWRGLWAWSWILLTGMFQQCCSEARGLWTLQNHRKKQREEGSAWVGVSLGRRHPTRRISAVLGMLWRSVEESGSCWGIHGGRRGACWGIRY